MGVPLSISLAIRRLGCDGAGGAQVAEGLTSEMSAEGLRFQKGPLGGFTGKPKARQLGVSGPPAASGMFVNPGKE